MSDNNIIYFTLGFSWKFRGKTGILPILTFSTVFSAPWCWCLFQTEIEINSKMNGGTIIQQKPLVPKN